MRGMLISGFSVLAGVTHRYLGGGLAVSPFAKSQN